MKIEKKNQNMCLENYIKVRVDWDIKHQLGNEESIETHTSCFNGLAELYW